MKLEGIDNALGEEIGRKKLLGWARCNKLKSDMNKC